MWPGELVLQSGGFTFLGTIHHEPTTRLLMAAKRQSEATALLWRTSAASSQTATLAALGRRYPSYPPSARLAKRWISCQLLSGLISERLVELLAAASFLVPGIRPPGKPPRHPVACTFTLGLPSLWICTAKRALRGGGPPPNDDDCSLL